MKHARSVQTSFLLLGLAFAVVACNRHKLPPVIRLNALDTMLVPLYNTIPLPTAIAFDREDLDISSKIVRTGSYDPDSIGYYPIQYEVSDAEGNVGRAMCTLRVMATPSQLTAYYDRTSDCPNAYDEIVYLRPDSQDPNMLNMGVFGSGGIYGGMRFILLPTGAYKPEVMPMQFYNSTRTVTRAELSFSRDGRIITLDLIGVDGSPYQCSVTFTRR